MMLAMLFVHPMEISTTTALWLVLPLCLCVTVVYKTVRTHNLQQLPRQIAVLMAYITGGLVVLAVGLWLVQQLFV
jgi:hypothetical protein